MKSRLKIALALGATIGAGLCAASGVYAQQINPAPGNSPPAAAASPDANAPAQQGRTGGRQRFSAEDRSAFFDARLAGVKAGLELTPDQQKLWDPVETAVRAAVKARQDARQAAMTQGRPADPIEALNRAADAATTRGTILHNLASAAQPLYASLTPDQKRRLPLLMRGMGMGGGMGMGMGEMRDHMREMMQRFRQGDGGRGGQFRGGSDYQDSGNHNRDGAMNGSQHM